MTTRYDDASTNYNSYITSFNGTSSMQSVLNFGAAGALNVGAWNNDPAAADLSKVLSDTETVSESFVTNLSAGSRKSLLDLGATAILNVGAFTHPDPVADLNKTLNDNIGAIAEAISLNNTLTTYPFNSLLNFGAADNKRTKADIGAWQTPLPKVAGVAPLIAGKTAINIIDYGYLKLPPTNVIDYSYLQIQPLELYMLFIDDLDDYTSYKMQVISGTATDNFTSSYIAFNFYSKHILVNVWDNPVDISLTRYGTDEFMTTVRDFGFLKKLSVRGYKIKNSSPGFPAKFQLIIMG